MPDRFFKLPRRSMRATSDVFPGKRSKPALHLIEPRCRRWGEVNMEPRVSSEPVFDRRRLVRAVVIHHQMNFQSGGHAGLDRAQELQEFTAAMATVQFTDDFPCGNVQRGKQSGGAVAHRVVSTALGNVGRQRHMGCVRSRAWIWLFSSTQSTIALRGGSRYKPTISRTLSTNSGSPESLRVSSRGFAVNRARQRADWA